MEAHAAAAHEHDDHAHGEHPPTAHVSSRGDARGLGRLLVIGAESLLVGSCTTRRW